MKFRFLKRYFYEWGHIEYFTTYISFPLLPTKVRGKCKLGAVLYLTWGAQGAYCLVNDEEGKVRHISAPVIV